MEGDITSLNTLKKALEAIYCIWSLIGKQSVEEFLWPFCDYAISGDSIFADHLATAHLSQSLANIVKLLKDCDDNQ